MYTARKVNVALDQHEKLKNAIANDKAVTIKLILGGGGDHTLLLTHAQIARIERAQIIGKAKLMIHLSKKQVKANVQHSGGFLGMLAGLAAKALPVLLGGLTTGLISGGIEKAIGGNGLYLHKSGHCVKVEPVKGNGLYLTPHARLSGVSGNGLYLKRGSSIYNGDGLLLGKNSPFKNIPILNLLL